MSVRRQNENFPTSRRPVVPASLKKPANENARPTASDGRSTTAKTTRPSSLETHTGTSKPEQKPSALHRTALSSLANNTPQQPRTIVRQPLSSKASTTTQTSSLRKSALTQKPSTAQLAAKAKPSARKPMSVYTPARAVIRRQEDSEDEVEYMHPKLTERPYEPPTPMRGSIPDKRDEAFLTLSPGRPADEPALDWSEEGEANAIRLGEIESPPRARIEGEDGGLGKEHLFDL